MFRGYLGGNMKRKRSREIAMELLFSMEISKNSYEQTIESFIENYEMDLKTIDLEYIKEVMKSVTDYKEEIDEIIKNSLDLLKNKEFDKTLSSFAASLDTTKIISANLTSSTESEQS